MQQSRREEFAHVLGHVREPMLLVARDGKIVAANVAAAEALGASVAALAGASLGEFSPNPPDLVGRLLQAAPGADSFPLRGRDGRRFSCDASLLDPDTLVMRLSGGPEASQRARVFFDMLPRLQGITSNAADARTVEELAKTLLSLSMSSVGAIAGGMYLLDHTGTTLELTGSVAYPDDIVDRFRLVPMAAPIPLTDSVRNATPIFLGTIEDYQTQYREFTQAHPRIAQRGMACIPLELPDRCIGTIGLGFPLGWQFSEADRSLLRELGLQCARTLERARRAGTGRGAGELAASRLERLHAFTGALAQAITPAEVAEAAVDAGMAATGARSGGLWLLSDDGTSVSLVRSVGPTGPRPEHFVNVPLDRPVRMPVLDAIRDGTPVWLESCQQLEERYPAAFRAFSRGGESSLACVPLLAQGRCIGGLVYNYDRVHRFLEDERAFFQVLTWYSAQALERARLYAAETQAREAAEADQRRSKFLAQAGTMLASTLDYASTLAAVVGTAVPHIADWCIVELEEDRLAGRPAIGAHADSSKLPFVLELSRRFRERGDDDARGIPGVIRTGRSLHYPSLNPAQIREGLRGDPELAELYLQTGLVSSMVVPISARGRTIGAILLNSANPARMYDEKDLAMAEELGRKVGSAVDSARLYRDAREADRLKDEFLAMLSHELRNPLAPILSAVELMGLREEDLFATERRLITRHVRHLVRLVDDLLDVSRITRGKVQLTKERCDLAQLIGDAVEMARPLVAERAHQLTVSVPARGLPIVADRVRIAQAIANVLTNAAKYTDSGGAIAVTAVAEGAEAILRVRDNGIGIAPDMLPRIFDLFVQGTGAFDRAQGGLGIGLTVVNNLIALHGGTVSAHSAGVGRGTEIVIRVPLDESAAAAVASHSAPIDARDLVLGRERVLVVDDNRDAATVLCELLEAVGCTTRLAHDGMSALSVALEFKPQLALLDIGLPIMDGYELAARLRELDRSLRLIAVTGYGRESDRARSRDAGFDEHIIKPVELATLRRVLEQFRGTR